MTDRREKINSYIQSHGDVSLNELATKFSSVSTMTIRRDLKFLESSGEIVRTKGGAKSISHLSMMKEDTYYAREGKNAELKMEIANKLAPLIEEGSSVYFDAGSTLIHLAGALGDKRLFAVTNSPITATELLRCPNISVSVTGGMLNRENIALCGVGAADFLKRLNISTAILVAAGYSDEYGFSCGNHDEAELKRAVIASSLRTIIVVDSSKVGKNLPFTFAVPGDADVIVTDSGIPRSILTELKKDKAQII